MEFRFDAGQELQLQAIGAVVGSEFHLFLPFRGLVNGVNLRFLTLVTTGTNVNARDVFGNTPLHFAVGKGHEAVVKMLLQNGAEVNIANEDLWTPLHLAATEGRARLAEILLENGAHINAKDTQGRTPLALAQYLGRTEVVNVLRQHGGL